MEYINNFEKSLFMKTKYNLSFTARFRIKVFTVIAAVLHSLKISVLILPLAQFSKTPYRQVVSVSMIVVLLFGVITSTGAPHQAKVWYASQRFDVQAMYASANSRLDFVKNASAQTLTQESVSDRQNMMGSLSIGTGYLPYFMDKIEHRTSTLTAGPALFRAPYRRCI